MEGVFKLLVIAVAAVMLIALIAGFFNPVSEDPITAIRRQLSAAQSTPGKLTPSKTLEFLNYIGFMSETFENEFMNVAFKCNLGLMCSNKDRIDFEERKIEIQKMDSLKVSSRCRDEENLFICRVYFGTRPAQIDELEIEFSEMEYNEEEERYETEADIEFGVDYTFVNSGELEAENINAFAEFYRIDKTAELISEEILSIGNLEINETKEGTLNLKSPKTEGKYKIKLHFEGDDTGYEDSQLDFFVKPRPCFAEKCTEPEWLKNQCITHCLCDDCVFGFTCRAHILDAEIEELQLPENIELEGEKSNIRGSNFVDFQVADSFCEYLDVQDPRLMFQDVPVAFGGTAEPEAPYGIDPDPEPAESEVSACDIVKEIINATVAGCTSINEIGGNGMDIKETDKASGVKMDWEYLINGIERDKIKVAIDEKGYLYVLNLKDLPIDVQLTVGQKFTPEDLSARGVQNIVTEHVYVPRCSYVKWLLPTENLNFSLEETCYIPKDEPVTGTPAWIPPYLTGEECVKEADLRARLSAYNKIRENFNLASKAGTMNHTGYYTENGEEIWVCHYGCHKADYPIYVKTEAAQQLGDYFFDVYIAEDYFDDYSDNLEFEYIDIVIITDSKPAIYLYPEKEENVNVKVWPLGEFSLTIPPYPKNGWEVIAKPNGDLVYGNEEFDYLFYEVDFDESVRIEHSEKEGWIVKYVELDSFFDNVLPKVGLEGKEIVQFKEYWLEKLKGEEVYYISLLDREEIDRIEPWEITPKPDTEIRIRFYYTPIEEEFEVLEPVVETPKREGFTVVEWGGIIAPKRIYFDKEAPTETETTEETVSNKIYRDPNNAKIIYDAENKKIIANLYKYDSQHLLSGIDVKIEIEGVGVETIVGPLEVTESANVAIYFEKTVAMEAPLTEPDISGNYKRTFEVGLEFIKNLVLNPGRVDEMGLFMRADPVTGWRLMNISKDCLKEKSEGNPCWTVDKMESVIVSPFHSVDVPSEGTFISDFFGFVKPESNWILNTSNERIALVLVSEIMPDSIAQDMIIEANKNNIHIYVILLVSKYAWDSNWYPEQGYEKGSNIWMEVAQKTGGKYYEIGSIGEANEAFQEISGKSISTERTEFTYTDAKHLTPAEITEENFKVEFELEEPLAEGTHNVKISVTNHTPESSNCNHPETTAVIKIGGTQDPSLLFKEVLDGWYSKNPNVSTTNTKIVYDVANKKIIVNLHKKDDEKLIKDVSVGLSIKKKGEDSFEFEPTNEPASVIFLVENGPLMQAPMSDPDEYPPGKNPNYLIAREVVNEGIKSVLMQPNRIKETASWQLEAYMSLGNHNPLRPLLDDCTELRAEGKKCSTPQEIIDNSYPPPPTRFRTKLWYERITKGLNSSRPMAGLKDAIEFLDESGTSNERIIVAFIMLDVISSIVQRVVYPAQQANVHIYVVGVSADWAWQEGGWMEQKGYGPGENNWDDIAEQTGGRYFSTSTFEEIRDILQDISTKTLVPSKSSFHYEDSISVSATSKTEEDLAVKFLNIDLEDGEYTMTVSVKGCTPIKSNCNTPSESATISITK